MESIIVIGLLMVWVLFLSIRVDKMSSQNGGEEIHNELLSLGILVRDSFYEQEAIGSTSEYILKSEAVEYRELDAGYYDVIIRNRFTTKETAKNLAPLLKKYEKEVREHKAKEKKEK